MNGEYRAVEIQSACTRSRYIRDRSRMWIEWYEKDERHEAYGINGSRVNGTEAK